MYSYDRRVASDLSTGTELEVASRRGTWPKDLFPRGAILVLTEGGEVGSNIKLKEKGQVMGGPYEFKVTEHKGDQYNLESTNDRFHRSLKVRLR